jgi:hypothetical protein
MSASFCLGASIFYPPKTPDLTGLLEAGWESIGNPAAISFPFQKFRQERPRAIFFCTMENK